MSDPPPPTSPHPPLQPLSYATPLPAGRPGIITAIGVISIVVGSLGILANLTSGVQALTFLVMSRAGGATTTTTTATEGGVTRTVNVQQGPAPAAADADADAGASQSEDAADLFASTALPPSHVKAVLEQINTLTADQLTPAQREVLTAELEREDQALILPAGSAEAAAAQVQNANLDDFGTLTLVLDAGPFVMETSGNVVWTPATLGNFGFSVSSTAAVLAMLLTVLGFALAVYLLVIGILIFRQSPNGARLHRIYALVKIPQAVALGLVWGWLWKSLFDSFGTMPAMPGSMTGFVIGMAAALVVISCMYPAALLITLRGSTVKQYYGAIRNEWAPPG